MKKIIEKLLMDNNVEFDSISEWAVIKDGKDIYQLQDPEDQDSVDYDPLRDIQFEFEGNTWNLIKQ